MGMGTAWGWGRLRPSLCLRVQAPLCKDKVTCKGQVILWTLHTPVPFPLSWIGIGSYHERRESQDSVCSGQEVRRYDGTDLIKAEHTTNQTSTTVLHPVTHQLAPEDCSKFSQISEAERFHDSPSCGVLTSLYLWLILVAKINISPSINQFLK